MVEWGIFVCKDCLLMGNCFHDAGMMEKPDRAQKRNTIIEREEMKGWKDRDRI